MTVPTVREISGKERTGFGSVFTAFMSQIISSLFTERTEILFAGHTVYPAVEADKLPDGLDRLLGSQIMVLLFTSVDSWQIQQLSHPRQNQEQLTVTLSKPSGQFKP